MEKVILTSNDSYRITWKDSIEWVQTILIFTMVNWFFALLSSLPAIIILRYYHLQSYIGTAILGYALAYTAFVLRNWNIIAQFLVKKIDSEGLNYKINVLSFVLVGITVAIYALLGIALHSEWLPFIIALWDYFILEKRAWYLSIAGWLTMITDILTRTKKAKMYGTTPISFLGLMIILRTLKRP